MGEGTELLRVCAAEHAFAEPGDGAQHAEGHDDGAQDVVGIVVELQVGRMERENENAPAQGPVGKFDEEDSPGCVWARGSPVSCYAGGPPARRRPEHFGRF